MRLISINYILNIIVGVYIYGKKKYGNTIIYWYIPHMKRMYTNNDFYVTIIDRLPLSKSACNY